MFSLVSLNPKESKDKKHRFFFFFPAQMYLIRLEKVRDGRAHTQWDECIGTCLACSGCLQTQQGETLPKVILKVIFFNCIQGNDKSNFAGHRDVEQCIQCIFVVEDSQ